MGRNGAGLRVGGGRCMVYALPMLVLAPNQSGPNPQSHHSGAVDVVTAVTFSHDWDSGSGRQ